MVFESISIKPLKPQQGSQSPSWAISNNAPYPESPVFCGICGTCGSLTQVGKSLLMILPLESTNLISTLFSSPQLIDWGEES